MYERHVHTRVFSGCFNKDLHPHLNATVQNLFFIPFFLTNYKSASVKGQTQSGYSAASQLGKPPSCPPKCSPSLVCLHKDKLIICPLVHIILLYSSLHVWYLDIASKMLPVDQAKINSYTATLNRYFMIAKGTTLWSFSKSSAFPLQVRPDFSGRFSVDGGHDIDKVTSSQRGAAGL